MYYYYYDSDEIAYIWSALVDIIEIHSRKRKAFENLIIYIAIVC